MSIYRATIEGRKSPLLIKADNKSDAKDRIVTSLELLNGDELETALTNGEKVWRQGDPLPADVDPDAPRSEAGFTPEQEDRIIELVEQRGLTIKDPETGVVRAKIGKTAGEVTE